MPTAHLAQAEAKPSREPALPAFHKGKKASLPHLPFRELLAHKPGLGRAGPPKREGQPTFYSHPASPHSATNQFPGNS